MVSYIGNHWKTIVSNGCRTTKPLAPIVSGPKTNIKPLISMVAFQLFIQWKYVYTWTPFKIRWSVWKTINTNGTHVKRPLKNHWLQWYLGKNHWPIHRYGQVDYHLSWTINQIMSFVQEKLRYWRAKQQAWPEPGSWWPWSSWVEAGRQRQWWASPTS